MSAWPLLVWAAVAVPLLAGAVVWLRTRGERTAVYWLWGADRRRPVYIGMTNDVIRRMRQHADRSGWWPLVVGPPTVRWYRSRQAAAVAERDAIYRDRPLHNDRYNRANPHRVLVYRPRRARVRA